MSRGNVHGPRQAGQKFHTLASPSLPARPPQAVVRARASPRTRIESHAVSAAAARNKGPSGRKRAITIVGDGALSVPQLRPADASDPVLLEMKKGVLLDVGNILNQFSNLDRSVRDFCDTCAEHIGKSKRLPRIGPHSPPVSRDNPVAKPASEFTTAEDYSFFVLLSIINNHIYADIYRPFHPAASPEENDQREEEYLTKIDTSLQLAAASWRSKSFKSIDVMVTGPRQSQLFQRIISSILHELNSALDPLPGPPTSTTLPDTFVPQLEAILKTAYKWNRTVKIEILKYDFEPFVIEPFSPWDPLQMESFERLRSPVRPDRKVISSVSLGLIGSVSLGGARVSHVQQKARVLVDEWFYNARGRTTSAGPSQSRPKQLASTPPPPLPTNKMTSPIVSQQPGASNQMLMRPPATSGRQPLPEPEPKKGFLCC